MEIGVHGVISRSKNNGEEAVVLTTLKSDPGMGLNARNFILGCV